MLVRYQNVVESHVAPAIGKELIKAGIAALVVKPPKKADTTPQFVVNETPQGYVALTMTILERVETYTGDPKHISGRTFGGHMPTGGPIWLVNWPSATNDHLRPRTSVCRSRRVH